MSRGNPNPNPTGTFAGASNGIGVGTNYLLGWDWPRLAGAALPLAIIGAIFVLVVPVPPALLDFLLAANITLAVLVLLTTLAIGTPQQFSSFPTILLTTTLFRLVLNVASTRLVLSRGAEDGLEAAGGVIRAFGDFVAGANDQVIVGAIMFLILVIIQFVVITKGATRISEVAARFMLDGLPGRQMAIDADLHSGLIEQHEAQRRREAVYRQADFFAAMDGAGKFVRGDAIAGLLIAGINIVGGFILGVFIHGMPFGEAVEVFTKLTIGDGLVSQIPAFLTALAAGLIVTRSTSETHLGRDVARQLLGRTDVVWIVAVLLVLLSFTPLPKAPLWLLASGLACAGFLLRAREQAAGLASSEQDDGNAAVSSSPTSGKTNAGATVNRIANANARNTRDGGGSSPAKPGQGHGQTHGHGHGHGQKHGQKQDGQGSGQTPNPGHAGISQSMAGERMEDLLHVDPLELEIGYRLIALADVSRQGDLLERIRRVRQNIAMELGVIVPPVRVRDEISLGPHEYRMKIRGVVVSRGTVYAGRLLAVPPAGQAPRSEGRDGIDPVTGQPAVWIHADGREVAELAGCLIREPPAVLAGHFHQTILDHAADLLTRDACEKLFDRVRQSSPALVDEVMPHLLRPGEIQRVLQNLVREQVSIRDLETILESLAEHAPRTRDAEALTESVRYALSRAIVQKYRGPDGRLRIVTLSKSLETRLQTAAANGRNYGQGHGHGQGLAFHSDASSSAASLPQDAARGVIRALAQMVSILVEGGHPAIVVCDGASRKMLKELCRADLPRLIVLSHREIPRETPLESVGTVVEQEVPVVSTVSTAVMGVK